MKILNNIITAVAGQNTPIRARLNSIVYELFCIAIEEVYVDYTTYNLLSKYLSCRYRTELDSLTKSSYYVSEFKQVGDFPKKYSNVITKLVNNTNVSNFIPTHKYKGAYFSFRISRDSSNSSDNLIRFIRGTLDTDALILEAYTHHVKSLKSSSEGTHFGRYSVLRLSGYSGFGNTGVSPLLMPTENKPISTATLSRDTSNSKLPSYPTANHLKYLGRDTPLTHSEEDTFSSPSRPNPEDVIGRYYFEDNVLECLTGLIQWAGEEEWFHNLKLPFSRGVLLEGPPGTGKSTLPMVLGEVIGVPVTYIGLEDITNQTFERNWEIASEIRPCVIVIEELDTFFDGRKPLNGCKLSFELLLSTISGASSTDGVALFITTNNLDKIDPAIGRSDTTTGDGEEISSRPGRIDTILHLGRMSEDKRLKMLNRILHDYPDLIEPTFIKTTGCTPAQVEFAAGQAALKKKRDLDEKQKEISSQVEESRISRVGDGV